MLPLLKNVMVLSRCDVIRFAPSLVVPDVDIVEGMQRFKKVAKRKRLIVHLI